jgi:hypothetical protein
MIVPGCAVSQVGMVALSVTLGACAAGSLPQAFPDPSPVVDLQVAEGDDGDERGQGPYDEVGAANSTADPCADFAAYACGPPGTRLRAARYYDWSGFRSIWRFIEELAKEKDRDDGSASGLVSDFYAVCTDAAARAQGISELRAQIDEIAGIQTFDDLARTLGRRDFFLAYAQQQCSIGNYASTEMELLRDPHAPARARVNNVVANIPRFAETFQCAPGAPMAPGLRCEIW